MSRRHPKRQNRGRKRLWKTRYRSRKDRVLEAAKSAQFWRQIHAGPPYPDGWLTTALREKGISR